MPNCGQWKGDGMLVQPVYDAFWDRLGLAPGEVGVEDGPVSYNQVSLPVLTAVPNPFNRAAIIAVGYWPLAIGKYKAVGINIYNVSGELVQKLKANRKLILLK
jgi:hypothetical protein